MARPTKQGLEYFSLDTDFFSDVKVRRISRACGPASTSILICLLCNIYRDKGYYIAWDENLPFVVADTIGTTEGAVEEVVKKAIQIGFFDKEMFDKHKILTSNGIQNRFKRAITRREEIAYVSDYLISARNNSVSARNNSVSAYNNSVSAYRNEQSKVKESKIKETSTIVEEKKAEQANKLAAAKAATLKRRDEFYNSMIPYVDRYGKEMIRNFFNYWSELNKSETKMRFETNKTWEISKRLATWARNEKNYDNKNIRNYPAIPNGAKSREEQTDREILEYAARAFGKDTFSSK